MISYEHGVKTLHHTDSRNLVYCNIKLKVLQALIKPIIIIINR
jgi:hypothetical protein